MGFIKRLGDYLLLLGIPGVFLIASLDSAAVPMVGGPDAVVLLLAWQKPDETPWIVLAASLGSLLGCCVLYQIGRTGRRLVFSAERTKGSWALRNLDRQAVGAILVATLAPPPFPTKAVILTAGIMQIGLRRFVPGVLAGRVVRYGVVGYVGARFGNQGMQILKDHYPAAVLVLVLVVVLAFILGRIRRPSQSEAEVPGSPKERN
jgi:membrane protein YqaA with SNARE-associated domain